MLSYFPLGHNAHSSILLKSSNDIPVEHKDSGIFKYQDGRFRVVCSERPDSECLHLKPGPTYQLHHDC